MTCSQKVTEENTKTMNQEIAEQTLDGERKQLNEKRAELKKRLEAIHRDIGRGLDKNSSERAVELENAEVLNEIGRVTQEELERIDEALAKLN